MAEPQVATGSRGAHRARWTGVALAAVMIGWASLMACSSSSDEATGPTTSFLGDNPAAGRFYQPPDPLPAGDPGDIIRSEPLDGAPAGSRAWRVLYHSTGLHGEDIAVSGMVFAPDGSSSSSSSSSTTSTTSGATTTARSGDASDHPVVAWAHPTTGVADTCAPSVLSDGPSLVAGLDAFLGAGFVVAATDYQGLGTPGLHPYLIGESEGRGTLDAVRAARQLDDAHAGTTVFTWGHSQGGQAALFAGQMAADYAPELDLAGVAAAAPAGELAEVFDLDENTVDGIALGGWAMNAFYEVYKGDHSNMDLDQMVTRAGQRALPRLERLCDIIPRQYDRIERIATPLIGGFYATDDPATVPPWGELLRENSPGGARAGAPVFLAQDTADQVVPERTTNRLARHLCSQGDTVDYRVYQGLSHTVIGYQSAPDALAWMQSILAGDTPPSTCR